MMTPTLLHIQGLTFAYPGNDGGPVFQDWSAAIDEGVTFVAGGDGRGKTTLLRLLAADLCALSGEISIQGVDSRAQPKAYRQQVFWADARDAAYDRLTPNEVFQTMAALYPTLNPALDSGLVNSLMNDLFLTEHAHKRLFMMSTGTRRKVLLVAGFASGAPVVLLDSPFAALDKPSIRAVKQHIQAIGAQAQRACVLTDYEAPEDLTLTATVNLGS
jgi:ABC-type multidrug transport system ATPase subunit